MHSAPTALALALALFAASTGLAQTIRLGGVNAPIYDEIGRLTQRLKAETASGPLDRPTLNSGTVQFYTEGRPAGTLVFDQAIYQKSIDSVSGSGRIEYRSDTGGDIAGTGFDYSLKTGLLQLRSDVVAHYFGTKITAAAADSHLTRPHAGQPWLPGDSEMRGNVVVVNLDNPKIPFDRAESEKVSYSGTTQILTVTSPLDLWRGGEKTRLATEKFEVDFKKAVSPEVPSAPNTTPAP